jgi:hypothetical protein
LNRSSQNGRFYRLNQVSISMKFVILFAKAARSYWSAFPSPYSNFRVRRDVDRPFLVETKDTPDTCVRMWYRVLGRDRYRCRGCDKKGKEVSLNIHQITTGSSHVDGVLTLCISCQALANNLELKGVDIPDFLRQLWRHLHRRVEPKYSELKTLKVGNNSP